MFTKLQVATRAEAVTRARDAGLGGRSQSHHVTRHGEREGTDLLTSAPGPIMPGLGHVTGREHIQDAFHQRLPNEEVAYLALHIQRVIEKT